MEAVVSETHLFAKKESVDFHTSSKCKANRMVEPASRVVLAEPAVLPSCGENGLLSVSLYRFERAIGYIWISVQRGVMNRRRAVMLTSVRACRHPVLSARPQQVGRQHLPDSACSCAVPWASGFTSSPARWRACGAKRPAQVPGGPSAAAWPGSSPDWLPPAHAPTPPLHFFRGADAQLQVWCSDCSWVPGPKV